MYIFQFGSAAYLAIGIQLIPITPISERRDNDQWLRQLYESYAESCDDGCVKEGWSVMLYCVLAELGHQEAARKMALSLPEDVFESAGGNGHSLTNTLWYISTRPTPEVPFDIEDPSASIHSKTVTEDDRHKTIDCGCPDSCTAKELKKTTSPGVTCKDRILWLMANKGLSQLGACNQVGFVEFESTCGMCDPAVCGAGLDTETESAEGETSSSSTICPPCDAKVCNSELNLCPLTNAPFLCYEGPARGGCSAMSWETDGLQCSACCELFQGCEQMPHDV